MAQNGEAVPHAERWIDLVHVEVKYLINYWMDCRGYPEVLHQTDLIQTTGLIAVLVYSEVSN